MGNRELEKAFKDGYDEIYGRPTPIRYDVLRLSDEHRKLDALFRRYYDALHPMVKDLFTSFALELKYLITELEKLEGEHATIREEYEIKKSQLDEELDDRIVELKDKIDELERNLETSYEENSKLTQKTKHLSDDLKAKEELILTQRNELDNLIAASTKLENLKSEQEETIHGTIEHVSKFTKRLETIEKEMQLLEDQKSRLEKENHNLEKQLKEAEDQYITQLEEINQHNNLLRKEVKRLTQEVSDLREDNQTMKGKLKIQEQDEDNFNFRITKLVAQNNKLKKENQVLQSTLSEKNQELSTIQDKYEDFQYLADKLLKHRDQLTEVSKADDSKYQEKESKVETKVSTQNKGWKPRSKTSLERELEKETITETQSEISPQDHLESIQRKLQIDDSESQSIRQTMISSKPDSTQLVQNKEKKHPQPSHKSEIDEMIKEHTPKIGDSFKKMEATLREDKQFEQSTTSLDKLMHHLNKRDVVTLEKFAEEFPQPLEEEKKDNKNSRKQKERTIKP